MLSACESFYSIYRLILFTYTYGHMQVLVGDNSLFNRNIISLEFMSSCIGTIRTKLNDNSFMFWLLDNWKSVYVLHIYVYMHTDLQFIIFPVFILADLVHCTNEPNVSIPHLANLLIERSQNANWVVVYKSLITTHHLMAYGNEVCI